MIPSPVSVTVSFIWSALSMLARNAARAGLLPSTRLAAKKVISVGNIQVGGAGKTPLVAQIAREAAERGLSVCILCRGYGAEWETTGGLIPPEALSLDAARCGDEAALLHDLAPKAHVAVGSRRSEQYSQARARLGRDFDLVILDDGFQHWKIRKDLEIVAVTPASPVKVLHRDWKGALKHADLLVHTKGSGPRAGYSGPQVRVRYQLPAPTSSRGVWLVTGVADGKSAVKSVRDAGYEVIRHISFPDHARYSEDMIRGILQGAAGSGCAVVVTGKDWVKWRGLGVERSQVQVLEPELIFVEGRETWLKTLWGEA